MSSSFIPQKKKNLLPLMHFFVTKPFSALVDPLSIPDDQISCAISLALL
jgi:hypothetical protein